MTTLPAGWKPIESAPKDGTPVLLFGRHVDATASTRVVGSFDNNGFGWIAQCYVGQPFARLVPSHWMELPAFPGTPPASAQDDAKVYHFEQRSRFGPWIEVEKPTEQSVEFVQRVAAPAAGDARDAERLDWLEQHDGRFFNKDRISSIVGVGFLVAGDPEGVRHQTVLSAIDAAIAAQRIGDA